MSNRDDGWDEEPEYDIDPDIEEYERYDDEEGTGGRRRSLMMLSVIALLVVFILPHICFSFSCLIFLVVNKQL